MHAIRVAKRRGPSAVENLKKTEFSIFFWIVCVIQIQKNCMLKNDRSLLIEKSVRVCVHQYLYSDFFHCTETALVGTAFWQRYKSLDTSSGRGRYERAKIFPLRNK